MLAVKVEYPSGKATVGVKAGEPVDKEKILAALQSIGYRGKYMTHEKVESP